MTVCRKEGQVSISYCHRSPELFEENLVYLSPPLGYFSDLLSPLSFLSQILPLEQTAQPGAALGAPFSVSSSHPGNAVSPFLKLRQKEDAPLKILLSTAEMIKKNTI